MFYNKQMEQKPFYTKEKKRWNVGHFPVGTVVKAKLSGQDESNYTVMSVTRGWAKNYLLYSSVLDLHKGQYTNVFFNINNVTSIVKRGNGKEYNETGRDQFTEMFFDCQKRGYMPAHVLVSFVAIPYLKPEMLFDVDQLTVELYRKGVLCNATIAGDIVYNKKKLRSSVKRLLNKYLVKHKVAEREENESYNPLAEQDYLDDNWEENSKEESAKSLGNGDDNYIGLGSDSLVDHENSPWLNDHQSSFNREIIVDVGKDPSKTI